MLVAMMPKVPPHHSTSRSLPDAQGICLNPCQRLPDERRNRPLI
uniref:Uncharacterized protein n=1 Tax=Arundo donax TaxID=35708 RepID=A0A0A9H6G4_ARUDO